MEEWHQVCALSSFLRLQRITVLKTRDSEFDAERGVLRALCSARSARGAAVPCPELQSLAPEKDSELAKRYCVVSNIGPSTGVA